MLPFLLLFCLSAALCLALTPLAREAARRCGLLDRPDGRRKTHARPTPVAGGLAILASAVLTLAVAILVPGPWTELLAEHQDELASLLPAALVIVLVGVADDVYRLRGRYKLLGQMVAVGLLMHSGLLIRSVRLFDWQLDLGPLAVPLTMMWLLGAVNSLNLLDGMDGLLGTVGLILSLALAVMALFVEQHAAACVAVALAGALVGFLRYNLPPASIFLGDAGSMLIGLVIGALAIQSSLKAPATVALVAPMALLAVPFFDTLAALVRRKLTGRSIYSTDRGHLHHCLLQRGFTSRRVLLCVGCCCLATAAGTLASLAFNSEAFALLTALAVVGVLVATRLFGYAEYLLVKDRVLAGAACVTHARTHEVEVRLQGAGEWQTLWDELVPAAERMNLTSLCLNVNAPAFHEGYHARWERLGREQDDADAWQAQVPIHVGGQNVGRLEVRGGRDHEPLWRKLARLLELMNAFEGRWAGAATAATSRSLRPVSVSLAALHEPALN